MLKSILFDSFRSIKGPTKIDLSKITILCGPNSAGKSSVIRALEFFSALSSEKPWEAHKGNAPISSTGEESPLQIGIEFTIENDIEESPRYDAYKNSLDGASPNDLGEAEYFWDSLKGKTLKIIVRFCQDPMQDNDDFFEFYVDDELALRIDNGFTYVDPLFRPINASGIDDPLSLLFEDEIQKVQGNLRVHKSLIGTYLFNHEDDDVHPINKLIWENDGEWSTTRGLSFLLFYDRPTTAVNSLVDADAGNFDFFSEEDDDFIERVLRSTLSKKILKLSKSSLKSERKKIFNGQTLRSIEEKLTGRLSRDAIQLKRFLEGLFLRLQAELKLSHVSGSRSIIDSKIPYHITNIAISHAEVGELKFPGQDDHIKNYLRYWWKNFPRSAKNGSEEKIPYDLVKSGLESLMPSLGRYKFNPIIFQVDNISDPSMYLKEGKSVMLPTDFLEGALVFPYLEISKSFIRRSFREVGSGLSFMMPIFSALTISKLTIIEQPELHLHPRAQCELGDVFAYAASNGRHSVVETHSEHLILRLSRRIRETSRSQLIPEDLKLEAQDVLIYYFCPEADNWTSISKIRLDEQGEFLDPWPDGFFGERSEELFS